MLRPQLEILKSQLATRSTRENTYRAALLRISVDAAAATAAAVCRVSECSYSAIK